jgi:hypothetical protein
VAHDRAQSYFGDRFWLAELDALVPQTGGVALLTGDSSGAWFAEDGQGGYIAPDG